MTDFQYENPAATAKRVPNEGWATKDFEVLRPMNSEMDVPGYPWETSPDLDFVVDPSGFVVPAPLDVVLITATQTVVQEAARDYVGRIGPKLPDEVRESFVHGAGMFDFPAPPDLDDHLG